VIYRGRDERNLCVVDAIVLEDSETFDVLVVEPLH
jgi:hypothetical protein